ncbi:MAG: hypothetical protein JNL19_13605 [Burkholderiales bacterium]|nr:hypothetical protein [Burkholderiales bacterium]
MAFGRDDRLADTIKAFINALGDGCDGTGHPAFVTISNPGQSNCMIGMETQTAQGRIQFLRPRVSTDQRRGKKSS